jgi:hypothetical protein
MAGWDLLDYFRGVRPWAQLQRLVEGFGPWTHTGRAIADDDDLQRDREDRLGLAKAGRSRRPRLTEWSETDEILATLRDVAERISKTVVQVNTPKGKSAPKFSPQFRPKSAHERAERRRDLDVVTEIVAAATPHAARDYSRLMDE